jgi:hypothetical protein
VGNNKSYIDYESLPLDNIKRDFYADVGLNKLIKRYGLSKRNMISVLRTLGCSLDTRTLGKIFKTMEVEIDGNTMVVDVTDLQQQKEVLIKARRRSLEGLPEHEIEKKIAYVDITNCLKCNIEFVSTDVLNIRRCPRCRRLQLNNQSNVVDNSISLRYNPQI